MARTAGDACQLTTDASIHLYNLLVKNASQLGDAAGHQSLEFATSNLTDVRGTDRPPVNSDNKCVKPGATPKQGIGRIENGGPEQRRRSAAD